MGDISKACGDLRERLQVLAVDTDAAGMRWLICRTVWGNVQPLKKETVFSRAGISAPGVQIVLRRQALQRTNALRWKGHHIFLTDIQPFGPGHILATGALVELASCTVEADMPGGGWRFLAVLTEKYIRHEQLEPYAINTLTYVLVTPKEVELKRGTLVWVNKIPYEVQLAHVLDSTKNEYEIVRTEDL